MLKLLFLVIGFLFGYFEDTDGEIAPINSNNLNEIDEELIKSNFNTNKDELKFNKFNVNSLTIEKDNDDITLSTYYNKREKTSNDENERNGKKTIRSWILERPMFVDEPGWLLIGGKNNEKHYYPKSIVDKDEPFYIARGKRYSLSNLTNYLKNNGKFNYIEQRNKHSDILDILNEPFFISRGKKSDNSNTNYPNIVSNYYQSANDDGNDNSMRDRRGNFVEQLLKEKDPFFIARGKKNIN